MTLLDYRTVTKKDLFLRNLRDQDIDFGTVKNNDLPVFFWLCMQYNLLEFVGQREYRGTLATLNVLRPFRLYMNLDGQNKIINLKENDRLDVTEILMTHPYYREPDPDNKRYKHMLHFDFPQHRRNKSYENFNYEM